MRQTSKPSTASSPWLCLHLVTDWPIFSPNSKSCSSTIFYKTNWRETLSQRLEPGWHLSTSAESCRWRSLGSHIRQQHLPHLRIRCASYQQGSEHCSYSTSGLGIRRRCLYCRDWRIPSNPLSQCPPKSAHHELRPLLWIQVWPWAAADVPDTSGSLHEYPPAEPYVSCRCWGHHARLARRPRLAIPGFWDLQAV